MDFAGMKRRELQALCKQHGLPAGGTNVALVARLDAALSRAAGAEEEVAGVQARKGCLKQTGRDGAEAKKVTFAAEEGKGRRRRSRVIWSPIVSKTRGKSAQASTDSAAEGGSISAEVGANVPVRRSRRNSVSAAAAEEAGVAVAVGRKRKRKNQEEDEGVAVSAQVGVSSRVTRRSSLAAAAAVLPPSPAVEKKRGRGKAAGGSSELAAQVGASSRVTRRSSLAGAAAVLDPAVEKKRGRGEAARVQKSAEVEVPPRITRSRSIAPVVMPPTVVENKRRNTGDAGTNVEPPTVSDVPRNDAPVTRSLRNRTVQVNNSMVDETHPARQLENKTQPSRPLTIRHQQVLFSVEDKNEGQIAAPDKAPLLRRSGRNHSEDAEKQPEAKELVKRSTRKSIVLATLEKEKNDQIDAEKNPEANVRRSMRKSVVAVKDVKGIGDNANREDAVKQPKTKGPVRGSKRKSVVSKLHEKEKSVIAEKNMEANEGRSARKPVMPVKDIKAVGEGIQNAKGKGVEKQFVMKQPTRRSSRKSVLPDILEKNSGLLAAEMNAEMNVRGSTRMSVFPNMLNENQDHSKMANKENFQSGKCQDDERQQKVKEPIRRSRRSVAAVPLEEQSNGLHEEKFSKYPMRRSTCKSVALNEVQKVSIDHNELEKVGEEGLKLRKHRRSSLEISSSANDSWRKQQDSQLPNEKDNTGGTQQASNSTTSEGRSSKRRRTTAPEEVMSVKANDDIIVMEATMDAHKATPEYKESSSSRVQEFGQVTATIEELSSAPLLVTVTPTDKISTAKNVPVVIPGSESGDNANDESSDKSKQDHPEVQAADTHLCETSGELDQSSCIAGLVPYNCVVSEVKASMSKGSEAALVISESDTNPEIYCNALAEESFRAADMEECPSRRSIGNPLSTSLHLEEKCIESYSRNAENTAVETDGGNKPSTPVTPGFYMRSDDNVQPTDCGADKKLDVVESVAEEFLAQEKRNDQHVPTMTDLNIKLNDEFAGPCTESGCSTTQNDAGIVADNIDEQMVQQDDVQERDLEKLSLCSATSVKPDNYLGCCCLEDEDVQPTKCDGDKKLDVDQGVAEEEVLDQEKSSNQHVLSKTDLNMMLNDELAGPVTESGCSITEKSARLVANNINEQAMILVQQGDVLEGDLQKLSLCSTTPLPEEIGGGIKPSTPVKPDSYVGYDCVEDNVQPSKCDADKKLGVDQGVTEEEVLDQERSSNQHVPAKTDLNMMLNDELAGPVTESGCSSIEKDARLVANNIAEQTIILVQQGDVQEGDLAKLSVCSATPLAEETGGGNKPSTPIDKKLDVDQGFAEEEFLAHQTSKDHHVPTMTDLNIKLNDEIAGPCMESGCSIAEKNARLFADNLDQQAIFQVQQGDVQEGDLKKPSPCSKTPDCKHKCGLPEGTALSPKDMGSLSSAEQSAFGLESLFSQENIDESMGSATAHTKNGFDDSKYCHVMSALENTHVSEPYSHDDTEESISKNDVCMQTSQQDNGMQGSEAALLISESDTNQEIYCNALAEESVRVADMEECPSRRSIGNPLSTSLHLEVAADDTILPVLNADTGCSSDGRPSSFGLALMFAEECIENYSRNGENTDVEIDGGNKPGTPVTPGFCMRSDENVQPTDCDADKKLDVDESVAEEFLAQEKRYDQHLPTKTDQSIKLNNEFAGPCTESGYSITENNAGLVADNIDEQAIIMVQQNDVQGDHEKPSLSPECRHECDLPEETVLPSRNKGSLQSAEQSPCGLESVGYGTLASATAHTENGFGESRDCHDKSAPEKTHVSEPFSHHDTEEGSSKNDDCMDTSWQDNEMEGFPEANLDEERVLSIFSSDAEHIKEVTNFEEVACAGEGSKKLFHSEELKPSSEKTNANDSNEYGITDAVLSSALHNTANDNYEICSGSNTDVLQQVHNDQCSNVTKDIIADASAKFIDREIVLLSGKERSNLKDGQLNSELEGAKVVESGLYFTKDIGNILDSGSVVGEITPSGSGLSKGSSKEYGQEVLDGFSLETSLDGSTMCREKVVCRVDAIENTSISLTTCGYFHEGALSEEAICTMKNYAGTCSSNKRELQSLFLKGNTKESPHDDVASPSAENSGDESINVEQRGKLHDISDLSHLDDNHKDRSNVDRVEQVASEPCTDNLAFTSAESRRDECIICHVEKLVDTHVSPEPDAYKGPCQDISRHEEKESCMSFPMQVNESGGFLRSSDMKGSLTSVLIDLADGAHLLSERQSLYHRDIVATMEVLCEEKVERKSVPTSDSDILQEKPYSNGHRHGICQSRSQKHIVEANSRLFSCGTELLHQDHEECNEPNEGKFSPKVLVENNMTEDAPIEGIGSSMMVPLVAEMSEIPDEQLNNKMGDESEELSFSCDKDTTENFCTGAAKRDLYPLPKDFDIDSCHKQEVPEPLSSRKSLEESAKFQCVCVSGPGPCQQCVNESTSMVVTYNIETFRQDLEEYNQNNDKDQTSPGVPSSSVREAVEIEQSEMEIGLIPAAEELGLPVPDKQLNNRLECNEVDEHNCSYDKDFSSLFGTDFLNKEACNLQKDDCMDLSSEENHTNDLPTPRSPELPAYFQNIDSGSVGSCQSSRQRGVSELRAKLQSFKVSSTVKGSYIAMSAPRPKPVDSMSQSAIALLRNRENISTVKAGHPAKPNADGKDSSRRALQPISGRPREH